MVGLDAAGHLVLVFHSSPLGLLFRLLGGDAGGVGGDGALLQIRASSSSSSSRVKYRVLIRDAGVGKQCGSSRALLDAVGLVSFGVCFGRRRRLTVVLVLLVSWRLVVVVFVVVVVGVVFAIVISVVVVVVVVVIFVAIATTASATIVLAVLFVLGALVLEPDLDLGLREAERGGQLGSLGQRQVLGAREALVEHLQLHARVDCARLAHFFALERAAANAAHHCGRAFAFV